MEDLVNRLLASSDPYISTLRERANKLNKKRKILPREAQLLIINPVVSEGNNSYSDSGEEIEEDILENSISNIENHEMMDIENNERKEDFKNTSPSHFSF